MGHLFPRIAADHAEAQRLLQLKTSFLPNADIAVARMCQVGLKIALPQGGLVAGLRQHAIDWLAELLDHKIRCDAAHDFKHAGQAGPDLEAIVFDPIECVLHKLCHLHRFDVDIAPKHVALK